LLYFSEVADLKEQRICYKFCFNLKKTASETYRTLTKAFYDDIMSRVQTLNGIHVSSHQTFECSGPPSLSQAGENVENKRRVGCSPQFVVVYCGWQNVDGGSTLK
jgi:hypothetical protein